MKADRLLERIAWWLLIAWLAFLAGVQFEKVNARHEAKILQRIEEGR